MGKTGRERRIEIKRRERKIVKEKDYLEKISSSQRVFGRAVVSIFQSMSTCDRKWVQRTFLVILQMPLSTDVPKREI